MAGALNEAGEPEDTPEPPYDAVQIIAAVAVSDYSDRSEGNANKFIHGCVGFIGINNKIHAHICSDYLSIRC